jgi:hypothetical protein
MIIYFMLQKKYDIGIIGNGTCVSHGYEQHTCFFVPKIKEGTICLRQNYRILYLHR